MTPPINAQMLLQMLQQRQGSTMPPLLTGPGGPPIPSMSQGADPTKPDASGGMLNPAGVAPGGQGTAIGPPAGPRNPNLINDPNELRETVTRMLQQPAPAVQMPAAPEYPAPPQPEQRPTGWGPRAILERITGGMAGMGGEMNPFEVQRQMRENRARTLYGSQVEAIQQQWKDKLMAAEAQQKAELERYQAQRQMLQGLGYALPAFGISRTGTQSAGEVKPSQIGKIDQQNGLPVSIMTAQGRLPITEQYLSQMEPTIRNLALNSLDVHTRWFTEQLKLLGARGAAFRLNNMYPMWDKQANQLVNKTGYEILKDEYRYIPAPSALVMARQFGVSPSSDVIRRGQNAVQTLQQLPRLQDLYDKVDQMGMTGPAHGRMFADFMAGKVGTTGMGPDADSAMGELRAANEFFRTRLTQAHLGGQSSEAERAAVRDILGRLSGTPEMYKGGLESAQSVLNDYASAVPGFGGGVSGITANPFQSGLPMNARQAPPKSNPAPAGMPKGATGKARGSDGKMHWADAKGNDYGPAE
jgi:hypothetical protein